MKVLKIEHAISSGNIAGMSLIPNTLTGSILKSPVQMQVGMTINTCQVTWLDQFKQQDENPYSVVTQKECHLFWTYCRDSLDEHFPRWAEGWPIADPPTPSDFLPGYCCLDTTTDSEHLGYNVRSLSSFTPYIIMYYIVIYLSHPYHYHNSNPMKSLTQIKA